MRCSWVLDYYDGEESKPWNRPVDNHWRKVANGREIRSIPIWAYCDDTSGNVSKRWGKLNSWLFNLVGLPADLVQLPYNTHFLCTSPHAPPLKMLEFIRLALWYVFALHYGSHEYITMTDFRSTL